MLISNNNALLRFFMLSFLVCFGAQLALDIPASIQLGLLSDSTILNRTSLTPGYCEPYNFKKRHESRCQLYGRCCAPAPVLVSQRLDEDTYHCHDRVYVIDKCPKTYVNQEIRETCEMVNNSTWHELSAAGWPVQSTENGVFYKNVYCAICNGIDTNTRLQSGGPKLDWPLAVLKVNFRLNESSEPDFLNLVDSKRAQVYYFVDYPLDACQEIIQSCPKDTNDEIINFCQRGPAINVAGRSGKVYRNSICAKCNGETTFSSSEPNRIQPHVITWSRTSDGTLFVYSENDLSVFHSMSDLAYVKMVDSNFNNSSGLLVNKFSAVPHYACSNLTLCGKLRADQHSFSVIHNNSYVWNLGSYECHSEHHDVCNHFMLTPNELNRCQKPGCKGRSLPNLRTKTCQVYDSYEEPAEMSKSEANEEWEFKLVCDYLSSCRVNESERNCYCDESCIYYGDCCHDAPNASAMKTNQLDVKTQCTTPVNGNITLNWGYREVVGCPVNYKDFRVKELCENNQPPQTWLQGTPPVSDDETGVRYANIYCAKCNGVQKPVFWKQQIRCVESSRGCSDISFPDIPSIDDYMFNVSSESLDSHASSCSQIFIPPKDLPTRHCRYGTEFIDSCPQSSNSILKKQCEEEPVSFVWDKPSDSLGNSTAIKLLKYRNSYCAICHGLNRPGCLVQPELKPQEPVAIRELAAFIYNIDYNSRTCHFDSQCYLTFPIEGTGRDSCVLFQNQLRSCGCSSTFDIDSKTCLKTGYPQICSGYPKNHWLRSQYSFSTYCPSFTYDPNKPENVSTNCSKCETCGSVVNIDAFLPHKNTSSPLAAVNVYCATLNGFIPRCLYYVPVVISPKTSNKLSVVSPDGSIAEIFDPLDTNSITLVTTDSEIVYNSDCSNSTVELIKPIDFLVCPGGQLKLSDGNHTALESIQSFYFTQKAICYVKSTPASKNTGITILQIIHYILISISLVSIIVYIVRYLKSKQYSISVTFFVFLIATLFVALLAYCFKLLAQNDENACLAVGVVLQYAFIAVHTWTNVFAIWIYRGVTKFELISKSNKKTIIKYSIYAWGIPLLIVIASLVTKFMRAEFFDPVYDDKSCFLGSLHSQLCFFLVPVYGFVITNTALSIIIIVILNKSSSIASSDRKRIKRNVFTCCKLLLVLGIHWVLLFLLFIPQSRQSRENLQTSLSIIIELQGLVVVLAYSISLKRVERVSGYFKSSSTSSTNFDNRHSRASKRLSYNSVPTDEPSSIRESNH